MERMESCDTFKTSAHFVHIVQTTNMTWFCLKNQDSVVKKEHVSGATFFIMDLMTFN